MLKSAGHSDHTHTIAVSCFSDSGISLLRFMGFIFYWREAAGLDLRLA